MSERVERIIKDYPGTVREIRCLREQIRNFEGVTEQEVIDTMNFSNPDGDRVQTSNIAGKTASIATTYRERVRRINREWIDHLTTKLAWLEEEMDFFHSSLRALSPEYASMMWDLVVEGLTWDYLERKYNICRATVGKYRKKAILELDALYAAHDREMADYILR
ncbi:MAG: hypothetical protein NC489_19815 [Ruminococcus flavefaciens]|nr:hypothetical protein [Ruminococcus flavefaciens]